jgi:hypothetical protein
MEVTQGRLRRCGFHIDIRQMQTWGFAGIVLAVFGHRFYEWIAPLGAAYIVGK